MNTKKYSTLAQLEKLLQQIHIQDGTILCSHGPSIPYFVGDDQYPGDLNKKLSNVLYDQYYSRGQFRSDTPEDAADRTSSISFTEKLDFIDKLKSSNNSEDAMDVGWKVEQSNPLGHLLIRKGQYRRMTKPGEYVYHQDIHQISEDSYVYLWKKGQEATRKNAFFFVYGQHLADQCEPFLVRFYFHLSPAGAAPLIDLLSSELNRQIIPFSFKCLIHPSLYYRADAGVLYVAKQYARPTWEILEENYASYQEYLRPATPLFTLPLLPGIGFAENPPYSDQSFGTSRCDIIANSLAEAHSKELSAQQQRDLVLQNLRNKNLNPDQLYLNPGSHYPYPF